MNRVVETLIIFAILTYLNTVGYVVFLGGLFLIVFSLILDAIELRRQEKELAKLKAEMEKNLDDLKKIFEEKEEN